VKSASHERTPVMFLLFSPTASGNQNSTAHRGTQSIGRPKRAAARTRARGFPYRGGDRVTDALQNAHWRRELTVARQPTDGVVH
jgi:hypothetical protein